MPLIKINDHEIEVDAGRRVIDIAKDLGIEIPHYCYHPELSVPANCRMCLVEWVGAPKLVPACSTQVFPSPPHRKTKIDDKEFDAVFLTNSPKVIDAQRSVMEFLLINHPLDCPWCDQAGECKLQDYSFEYGDGESRYNYEKRTFPRKTLGPNVLLFTNRCIMCTRCVRFSDEISGGSELMVFQRGGKAQIDIYPDQPIDNPVASCVTDICPVGALVSKDFLYKPRVWNYSKVDTVCGMCSTNCNISVNIKNNMIYRIKPRENQQVNSHWMCDQGRLGYNRWQQEVDRLNTPMIRRGEHLEPVTWDEAYQYIKDRLKDIKPAEIAGIASPYCTNEDNYLFRRLFEDIIQSRLVAYADGAKWDAWHAKKGVFKISEFKSSNAQGVRDVVGERPKGEIIEKISKIQIKALYWIGGNLDETLTEGEKDALQKLKFLIVQDVWASPATEYADVVLPGTNYYEKNGTFTNADGVIQFVSAVVDYPEGAKPDWEIFAELGQKLGGSLNYTNLSTLTKELLSKVRHYTYLKIDDIGQTGIKTRKQLT